jgi:hypothetical protein
MVYIPVFMRENSPWISFPMSETLYQKIGGEAKLRQVIDTFIDRVVFSFATQTRRGSRKWSFN